MDMPNTSNNALTEHTFGREHFSPPPLQQELGEGMKAAGQAEEDALDWVQRIRNVGEW